MKPTNEAVADKILDPVLDKLGKLYKTHDDKAIGEILENMIHVMVLRRVMDSLSIREEMLDEYSEAEIMKLVGAKFKDMRQGVEMCIAAAFEVGVTESYNQDIEYTCVIKPSAKPTNVLPC